MKVSEIFLSNMVNDDTDVNILKGGRKLSGNWYQDHIIEFSEYEVSMLLYDKESNRVGIEVEA